MAVSKLAKSKDTAHTNRMKKLTPKQRFKTLSKVDQHIIIGCTLADLLNLKREKKGDKHKWAGRYFSISQIKADYVEQDAATGVLTDRSVQKIKRVASSAIKRFLGKDALFCIAIEEQDKLGAPCPPHLHIIAIDQWNLGTLPALKEALQKVAGATGKGVVKHKYLSEFVGLKHHKARVRDEADFRRAAGYNAKNNHTRFYRSKSVIRHVPSVYEAIKTHYRTEGK